MALNDSPAARQRAAAEDLARKLRLEARADREFRELFRIMARDLAALYEETGSAIRADEFEEDVRGLLLRQNRRVSEAFSGRVIDYLDENIEDEEDATIAGVIAIAAALGLTARALVRRIRSLTRTSTQAFTREQAATDATLITLTNQAEIDFVIQKAREDLGDEASNRQVGRAAGRDFSRRGIGRSQTIAATTTQKIAENTKNIERQQFFNARNGFNAVANDIPQEPEVEVWTTIGDSVVRPAHVAADETRKVDGFFTVGGEQLLYPGDPAGSPGNVINCRCSAQLVFEERAAESFVPEQLPVEPDDENTPAAFS